MHLVSRTILCRAFNIRWNPISRVAGPLYTPHGGQNSSTTNELTVLTHTTMLQRPTGVSLPLPPPLPWWEKCWKDCGRPGEIRSFGQLLVGSWSWVFFWDASRHELVSSSSSSFVSFYFFVGFFLFLFIAVFLRLSDFCLWFGELCFALIQSFAVDMANTENQSSIIIHRINVVYLSSHQAI